MKNEIKSIPYGKFRELAAALKQDGVVLVDKHFINQSIIDIVSKEWLAVKNPAFDKTGVFLAPSYKTYPKTLNAKASINLSKQLKIIGDKILHYIVQDLKLEYKLSHSTVTQILKYPIDEEAQTVDTQDILLKLSVAPKDSNVVLDNAGLTEIGSLEGKIIVTSGDVLSSLTPHEEYPTVNLGILPKDAAQILTSFIYKL